jgi:hypothetical protein
MCKAGRAGIPTWRRLGSAAILDSVSGGLPTRRYGRKFEANAKSDFQHLLKPRQIPRAVGCCKKNFIAISPAVHPVLTASAPRGKFPK